MGYTTRFEGQVDVHPPLTAREVHSLTVFSQTRHEGASAVGCPGIWCDWEPTDDGDAIVWNGAEKFYDSPEWMKYLIDHLLTGHVLNGEIQAYGESPDDRWKLIVTDNIVSVATAVHIVYGPPRRI